MTARPTNSPACILEGEASCETDVASASAAAAVAAVTAAATIVDVFAPEPELEFELALAPPLVLALTLALALPPLPSPLSKVHSPLATSCIKSSFRIILSVLPSLYLKVVLEIGRGTWHAGTVSGRRGREGEGGRRKMEERMDDE